MIEDLEIGTGVEANAGSDVTVAYVGMLEDGTVFDRTAEGQTADFNLAGTIEGFRDGVAGMREGGRRRITIPPNLGYGATGVVDRDGTVIIPPCETLVFEVTLVEVR